MLVRLGMASYFLCGAVHGLIQSSALERHFCAERVYPPTSLYMTSLVSLLVA